MTDQNDNEEEIPEWQFLEDGVVLIATFFSAVFMLIFDSIKNLCVALWHFIFAEDDKE